MGLNCTPRTHNNCHTMPVESLPEDKPKIVFHAAMMAIQNFGFFTMYYDTWGATPHVETCDTTRAAVSMMALTCFCVTFLCVAMGFGGYIDSKAQFTLFWFAHLIGGSFYTACTVTIPSARFSDEGVECAKLAPVTGERIASVYYLHAALYLVYVGGMLSITYFSFLKSLIKDRKPPPLIAIVGAALFFVVPQTIVYVTTPGIGA